MKHNLKADTDISMKQIDEGKGISNREAKAELPSW